ncbi:MAG: hypothetical protein ABI693_02875 [Bryobacteraceae bacterium]
MKGCTVLSLLLLANLAFAADSVSGTWKIDGDVAGNPVQESCTVKQEAEKLTGSCKGLGDKAWDVTGAVEGQSVTFQHGGEYNGEALTLTYKGTIDATGAMKGTIDVKPFDVSGDFSAKKEN